MFTATTGRLPQPPLVVFKLLLLQTCYGLSDPPCEEQVRDRLSWRRFTGLSLTDPVPDETTLVRCRQRLVTHGLLVRAVTLVDATLIQAARRAPAKTAPAGGAPAADHTVKRGQPHYGDKAHVAADGAHTLIRRADLSAPASTTTSASTLSSPATSTPSTPTKRITAGRARRGCAPVASPTASCGAARAATRSARRRTA